jgi:hypothetical protein
MEKKSSVTLMSSSIQPDSLTNADATSALAAQQSGMVHHLPRSPSWDPYEVWLNRVHRPRAEQGVRDTLKAQAQPVRDASGVMNAGPLTIVQTSAR